MEKKYFTVDYFNVNEVIDYECKRDTELWDEERKEHSDYKLLYDYYEKLDLIQIKYVNILRSKRMDCKDALASYLDEVQTLTNSFYEDDCLEKYSEEWEGGLESADGCILREIRNISRGCISTDVFTVYTIANIPE